MANLTKKTLSILLAVLIIAGTAAGCNNNPSSDVSSAADLESIEVIPSEAQVDLESGEITIAGGSTLQKLIDDLTANGTLTEGSTLRLYLSDGITEVTDTAAQLEEGAVAIITDPNGNETYRLTIHLVFEIAPVASVYVDSEGNTVRVDSEGNAVVVNSIGEIVSEYVVSRGNPTTSRTAASAHEPNDPTSAGGTSSITITSLEEVSIASLGSLTDDRVRLTLAGDSTDAALMMAIREYQKKHSNVSIKVTSAPNVAYSGKYTRLDGLKMQLFSNRAPDIVNMDQYMISTAGYQNYLLELSQFGSDDVKDLYIESCWDACSSQGKLYGLPFDANVMTLFYNKDILDAAGATVPNTYDELINVCSRVKSYSDTLNPYALSGGDWMWMMWLWRCGGDLFTDDYKSAVFDSEAGVKSLQMMLDFTQKYHAKAGETYEGNIAQLAAKEAAMCVTNSVWYDSFFGPNKAANFGVTMLPELESGIPRYSGLGLYALALPNKVSHLTSEAEKQKAIEVAQIAYDFIEFYSSNLEYQATYCKKMNLLPSLVAGKNDPFYQTDFYKVVYDQLAVSKYRPGVRNFETISGYLEDAVDAVMKGSKNPQEALKAAAVATNRQLQ